MSIEAKRPRMDKSNGNKRNYYAKPWNNTRAKTLLQPGHRGFLVTCNYRERECIRDGYRLLNEYADEMYGKLEQPGDEKVPTNGNSIECEQEEEDISVLVQKQAEAINTEKRQYRFESVDTGAKNCCFIKTNLKENPRDLALKILRDLNETKQHKSQNILRMIPIEVVSRANLKDIMDAAGGLFDKYFLKEPKTFAIIFNHRFNKGVDRDSVIDELAGMISAKNLGNKANLKNPDLAVIVEVIKGLCLISVVPDYFLLRKYNMVEICAKKEDDEGKPEGVELKDKTEENVSQQKPEADADISQEDATKDAEKDPETDGKQPEKVSEDVPQEELNKPEAVPSTE